MLKLISPVLKNYSPHLKCNACIYATCTTPLGITSLLSPSFQHQSTYKLCVWIKDLFQHLTWEVRAASLSAEICTLFVMGLPAEWCLFFPSTLSHLWKNQILSRNSWSLDLRIPQDMITNLFLDFYFYFNSRYVSLALPSVWSRAKWGPFPALTCTGISTLMACPLPVALITHAHPLVFCSAH